MCDEFNYRAGYVIIMLLPVIIMLLPQNAVFLNIFWGNKVWSTCKCYQQTRDTTVPSAPTHSK